MAAPEHPPLFPLARRNQGARRFIARLAAVSPLATPLVASARSAPTAAAPSPTAGALDTTFRADGKVVVTAATGFAVGSGTRATGVALYPSGVGNDGRILLGGGQSGALFAARL